MCVALPMQVERITGQRAFLAAMGVHMEADISLVEGVVPGDYVLVHAGFAIAKIESEEAKERLGLFGEIEHLTLGHPADHEGNEEHEGNSMG